MNGHYDMVALLIAQGSNINAMDQVKTITNNVLRNRLRMAGLACTMRRRPVTSTFCVCSFSPPQTHELKLKKVSKKYLRTDRVISFYRQNSTMLRCVFQSHRLSILSHATRARHQCAYGGSTRLFAIYFDKYMRKRFAVHIRSNGLR